MEILGPNGYTLPMTYETDPETEEVYPVYRYFCDKELSIDCSEVDTLLVVHDGTKTLKAELDSTEDPSKIRTLLYVDNSGTIETKVELSLQNYR